MYAFVTGPLAWLSFTVFIVGIIARIIWYFRGLNWQMDRVAYKEHMAFGIKGAIRSIVFWLIPFGTHSWRFYPFFTICFFTFHIGLLFTPLFISGHNVLLQERFGWSLWAMPAGMAGASSFSLISETRASVMSIRPAIEEAFSSAVFVTLAGSMTPAFTRSSISPVAAL